MWYADKHAENIWSFKLNPLKETKKVILITILRLSTGELKEMPH